MITIHNISMRNFLSVGQATQAVNLSSVGLTLILGQNIDVGATNSRNGCGKSTLTQAISFGLYGEAITSIRKDNLVNNINSKGMMVTIDFERDGKSYRIERGRKPNLLRFLVKDKDAKLNHVLPTDDAQGENKQTQFEIERIIGMSHNLFVHLVALNTYVQPFLKLKPAEQREVIEELLGITQLSLRDEVLTKLIVETKRILRDEEVSVNATIEANGRIKRAIDRAIEEQNSWNIAQKVKIDRIAGQIAEISDINFDAEIAIFDAIEQWNNNVRELTTVRTVHISESESISKEAKMLNAEITRLKSNTETNFQSKIIRLEAEKTRCEAECKKTVDASIIRLKNDSARRKSDAEARLLLAVAKQKELDSILLEIENSDGHTCTTCGQGLEGTSHLDNIIQKLEAKVTILEKEITKYNADVASLHKESEDILLEIKKIEAEHADKQIEWQARAVEINVELEEIYGQEAEAGAKNLLKIFEIENELEIINQILSERATILSDIENNIAMLGKKPISSYLNKEAVWKVRDMKDKLLAELEREVEKENPHNSNVLSLQSTIQEISYVFLNETQVTLKHQEFLHKLLSGKDSFVRKKIIDQNLMYLNTRMNKYLEALALPHEVKFMPDLTVDISLLGQQYDFEQLSRGEQTRVIVAVSFAFRDVWESQNTSINLVFIDELFDMGIDTHGGESAISILNKMALERGKNVFLISHKEELMGRVNHILMVRKEGGFSTFQEDAEVV